MLYLVIINNMKKWVVNYNWNQYGYTVKDEIVFWKKAIRVVCKWAWMDEIFATEDLNLVIRDIIPDYINIKQNENKSTNLQIRIRQSDKEKLKELAKKEKLSVSDLIVKKILV